MKAKKIFIPFVLLASFLAISTIDNNSATSVNAAFIEETAISEDFDKKTLDSDYWETNDASLNVDHYSLRFHPEIYQWTANLLLQDYYMSESYVMEVECMSTGKDEWLGVSFGIKEKAGLFSDANFALIFYSTFGGSDNPPGIACTISEQGYLAPNYSTGNLFATPFYQYGTKAKLRIHVDIIDYNYSEVYYDIISFDGKMLKEHDPIKDVYQVNRNLSGYVGFNDSGNPIEITHFSLKKALDSSLIYEDDFTSSSIQYATTGSGAWATKTFSTNDVSLGPVGNLELKGNDSSITYKNKFKNPETSTIDINYFASMSISYNAMSKNSLVGFEIGKDSLSGNGDIFGLQKEKFGYNLVHLSKDGQVVETINCPNNAPGNTVTLSLTVKTNGAVIISTSTTELKGNANSQEGYLGIKNVSLDGQTCVGPTIDDVLINRTIDNQDATPDVAINFNGTQHKTAGYFEYDDFYVSKKEWKMTTTSDMFLSSYDDSIDPDNPDGKLYYANSTNSTKFGSKNKYTDYVVKFKLQVLTDEQYLQDTAGFALEYGLEKFDVYYDNAQSVGLYNVGKGDNKQSLIIMRHCVDKNTGYNSLDFPLGNDKYAQLFAKRNGEYPTFDVMYIVKDGYVSMHFKYEDEPMSVLSYPRVIAKAEGSTSGYCCLVGTYGLDFSIDDFSITNLDFVTKNETYVPYNDNEYQIKTRKDFATSSDTSGLNLSSGAEYKDKALLIPNGTSLKTEGKTSDGLYRMKFNDIESSASIKLGNASIKLINDKNSKKAVIEDKNHQETLDLGNDFVFAGSTFEITRIGTKLNIKYVSGDTPLSAIMKQTYEFDLLVEPTYDYFEIASEGMTSLSDFTFVNFDSHQTIAARNYDAATDTVVAWVTRTSVQDLEKKGCKGSLTSTSLILTLSAIVMIIFISMRRKETF